MTRMPSLPILAALAGLSATAAALSRAATSGMRRVAVIVGANDPPPGRPALRFAHDDARELAAVLEQVGGFSASDVRLLFDPHPVDLVAALDDVAKTTRGSAADVLFVFYYSGHSDGQALFPHGEPIALADLRERVEHLGARTRVGILDTCRGGSWTPVAQRRHGGARARGTRRHADRAPTGTLSRAQRRGRAGLREGSRSAAWGDFDVGRGATRGDRQREARDQRARRAIPSRTAT